MECMVELEKDSEGKTIVKIEQIEGTKTTIQREKITLPEAYAQLGLIQKKEIEGAKQFSEFKNRIIAEKEIWEKIIQTLNSVPAVSKNGSRRKAKVN